MFQRISEALLDIIYPRFCIGCGSSGLVICRQCLGEIDYYFLPVRLQLEPLYVDEYMVVARLEGIIRKLIHAMKYASIAELATVAGKLLYLSSEWPVADIVTAVPLHPHRLNERGYNQAELIGRSFAKHAQIPYVELLTRTVDTPHQAQQLTREDRKQNITDYFSVLQQQNASSFLHDKHIILIDDVCTTGITLNHCAKVLKSGGCKRVTALTVAHGH